MTSDHPYAEWSDGECVNAILELRAKRLAQDIPKVRLVSRVNRAGYDITTAEYSVFEDTPLRGAPHIRRGILDALAQAFDPDVDLNESDPLIRATELMFRYRTKLHMTHDQIARELAGQGHAVSPAQYRAIEQGMTLKVPYGVIVSAAKVLGIPARELLPELES